MNLQSIYSNIKTEAHSLYSSATNLPQKFGFTSTHFGSYIACYSIFQSMNAIYNEQAKELGESNWSMFHYAHATICLTAGVVHLYVTRKNIEARNSIKEKYLNNENKLPKNKKEVCLAIRSNVDETGALDFEPAYLYSDLNKINSIHPVVFKEINGFQDILTAEKLLRKKGKKIKDFYIHVHSCKTSIPLGNDRLVIPSSDEFKLKEEMLNGVRSELKLNKKKFDLLLKKAGIQSYTNNNKDFKKILSLLDKKAQIILHSCEAGKETQNIAEHISSLGNGRKVIAAQTTLTQRSLKVEIDGNSPNSKLSYKFIEPQWEASWCYLFMGFNYLSVTPHILGIASHSSLGVFCSNVILNYEISRLIWKPLNHDVTNTVRLFPHQTKMT